MSETNDSQNSQSQFETLLILTVQSNQALLELLSQNQQTMQGLILQNQSLIQQNQLLTHSSPSILAQSSPKEDDGLPYQADDEDEFDESKGTVLVGDLEYLSVNESGEVTLESHAEDESGFPADEYDRELMGM